MRITGRTCALTTATARRILRRSIAQRSVLFASGRTLALRAARARCAQSADFTGGLVRDNKKGGALR